MADRDAEKRAAAEAAAELVRDGDKVGLGTGSTVAPMLPALAARKLNIRCVATSIATEVAARALGIEVEPFEQLDRLDIAIDGADQIDPEGWLVKGGGGAHTREKVVAAAADRFVVIASSDKVVDRIVAPIPLELLAFGLPGDAAAARRRRSCATCRSRPTAARSPTTSARSPDPAAIAARLSATPGVVDHGLFGPELVSDVLIARGSEIEHRTIE